jgi:hypothetical protein
MKRLMLIVLTLCVAYIANGQKVLSKTETKYVIEAKSQLVAALSDIDMSDSERLRIIQRSAVTLKEYGQPAVWPAGKIPLQELMDQQFDQCKEEIAAMSDWSLKLENKTLDQKMKIINTMQIDVIENQVQILIPGLTPVQLSSDVISTVFGINIVQGVNGGKRQDAKDLANRFKKLAESKELIKHINMLVENHRESLRLIDEDIELLNKKVLLWKKAFVNAYNGAFTFKGYEGAKLNRNSVENSSPLVGTWYYKEDGVIVTGYTFNSDNSATQIMYGEKYTGWTWEAKGSTLYLIGGNGKRNSWEYRIDNGKLYLTVEVNGESVEGLPLTKQ